MKNNKFRLLLCFILMYSFVFGNNLTIFANNIISEEEMIISQNIQKIGDNANWRIADTESNFVQLLDEFGNDITNDEDVIVEYCIIDTTDLVRNYIKPTETSTTIIARASASQTATGKDSTYSIEGSITITYDINSSGNYLLTKVSGKYTILDNQVKVSSQSLSYGCNGLGPNGTIGNQNKTASPSGSSWSYNTNFSNYIFKSSEWALGANVTFNIERGTSSKWSLKLSSDL